MNQLDDETRARVLACLCEGMGIRPTVRVTGVAKNTIQALLRDVGRACHLLEERRFKNLPCADIQCDEAWAFCYAREKNVPPAHKGEWGYGDVWTWTAVCRDTKLVPAWELGPRNQGTAAQLLGKLAYRLPHRVQLSTDGFPGYQTGVLRFCVIRGDGIDWGTVVKNFATPNSQWDSRGNRYEQPAVTSITKRAKTGDPAPERICTSHVERMNLGLRMHCRKYTRLTNGHAKKVQNLAFALALHFAYYNWCKPHGSLDGFTPAQAAGLTDRLWTVRDLVDLLKPAPERGLFSGPKARNPN